MIYRYVTESQEDEEWAYVKKHNLNCCVVVIPDPPPVHKAKIARRAVEAELAPAHQAKRAKTAQAVTGELPHVRGC